MKTSTTLKTLPALALLIQPAFATESNDQAGWTKFEVTTLTALDQAGLLQGSEVERWKSALDSDDTFTSKPSSTTEDSYKVFVGNATVTELRVADMYAQSNAALEEKHGPHPRGRAWLGVDNSVAFRRVSGGIEELTLVAGNATIADDGSIVPAPGAVDSADDSFIVWSLPLLQLGRQEAVDFYSGEGKFDWARRWESFSTYRRGPFCSGTPQNCQGRNEGLYTQIRSWWIVVPVLEEVEQSRQWDYSVAFVESAMEAHGAGSEYSWAQQGFRSNNASAAFLETSPRQDYRGDCVDTTVNAGFSQAGFSGGVSRTVKQCETWRLNGATSTRGWFSLSYLDDGQAGTRSLSQAITFRYNEGTTAEPAIGHGINYRCNAPGWDFLSGGCAL